MFELGDIVITKSYSYLVISLAEGFGLLCLDNVKLMITADDLQTLTKSIEFETILKDFDVNIRRN